MSLNGSGEVCKNDACLLWGNGIVGFNIAIGMSLHPPRVFLAMNRIRPRLMHASMILTGRCLSKSMQAELHAIWYSTWEARWYFGHQASLTMTINGLCMRQVSAYTLFEAMEQSLPPLMKLLEQEGHSPFPL